MPRARLLALGRRHGQAHIPGALFAAARLPARQLLGPALETTGKLMPRSGAFQILTVITGTQAFVGRTPDDGGRRHL